MSTKLTLTVDKAVIEEAKKYAKSQGRSLSNIIEEYLKALVEPQDAELEKNIELSPIVKALWGSVKVPNKDFDYKEVVQEELLKKYGL